MTGELGIPARGSRRAHQVLALCLIFAAVLAVVPGCGDDGGSPQQISVLLSTDSTGVEVCATKAFAAAVANGQASEVAWYVNGTLGGNSTVGTISQGNPATYSAPDNIPAPATVTVRVVSSEDATKADSCRVTVKFTVLHVSASEGSDGTGTGCITKPFKTIKRGLAVADSGKTVLVAPGIYDAANGETFAMYVGKGISLVGEDRETTVIRKSPLGLDEIGIQTNGARCAIRNFTIDEGDPAYAEWSYAILVNNISPNAVIDSIIFPDRGVNSVIRINAATNATVTNCEFVVDDGQELSRGMELIGSDTGTTVHSCVFTGYVEGIFLNSSSNALIQGCTFDGNSYGVGTCCYNSDTSNPNPDLGGGARGSLGGNIFGDNSACGLSNETKSNIYAKYNTWAHTPPVAGVDYCNIGTGSVIVE